MDTTPMYFPEKDDRAKARWDKLNKSELGAWQSAFYIASGMYNPTGLPFLDESKDAFRDKDKSKGTDLGSVLGLLDPKTANNKERTPVLKSNPASHIFSSGIRHVPGNRDFVVACTSWVPTIPQDVSKAKAVAQTIASQGKKAWSESSQSYFIHQLILDDKYQYENVELVDVFEDTETVEDTNTPEDTKTLKKGFKTGSAWTCEVNLKDPALKLKLEPMVLEHYFECRFAGPLLLQLICKSTEDNTREDAMILLDRIVNNPHNLTWAPESLNKKKKAFFDGTPIVDESERQGLTRYMNECSRAFKALVGRLISTCIAIEGYSETSVTMRMLAILWYSPFCMGHWDLLPRTSTGGPLQWTAYVQANKPNPNDQITFTVRSSGDSIAKSWTIGTRTDLAAVAPVPIKIKKEKEGEREKESEDPIQISGSEGESTNRTRKTSVIGLQPKRSGGLLKK